MIHVVFVQALLHHEKLVIVAVDEYTSRLARPSCSPMQNAI